MSIHKDKFQTFVSDTPQYELSVADDGTIILPADHGMALATDGKSGPDNPRDAMVILRTHFVSLVRRLSSDECRRFGEMMVEMANAIEARAASEAKEALDRISKGRR